MQDDPKLTIHLAPEGDGPPTSLHIEYRALRRLAWAAAGLVLVLAIFVGSWWYLAARAVQADRLEGTVAELETELAQVEQLAQSLLEVERAYENLRGLFAAPGGDAAGNVLPPALGRPGASAAADGPAGLPTSWPLTERGFLTQPLIEGGGTGEEHPGIDIAIPAGSYIRAAGPGTVAELGEDPVYGLYLILDHGDGYRSLYAHASRITVGQGESVRREQVIGLTGSTGRSTAPHLHFEILRDGELVDPLELVERP